TDIPASQYPYQIEIADLDQDNKPDIAISYYLTSQAVSVFKNTSTSGTVSFASKVDYTMASNPDGISINDLDGDGKLDMAVCSGTDSVSILRNTASAGSGISFASPVKFASFWGGPIYTADFDG